MLTNQTVTEARFWGEVNPDFFKGTVVEKAAAEVLGNGR